MENTVDEFWAAVGAEDGAAFVSDAAPDGETLDDGVFAFAAVEMEWAVILCGCAAAIDYAALRTVACEDCSFSPLSFHAPLFWSQYGFLLWRGLC